MISLLWEPAAADPIPAVSPDHAAAPGISPDPFPSRHFGDPSRGGIPWPGMQEGQHAAPLGR